MATQNITDAGITVGMRVEAGVGEDHDVGRVLEISEVGPASVGAEHGPFARIGWDSGVQTWASLSDLTAVSS